MGKKPADAEPAGEQDKPKEKEKDKEKEKSTDRENEKRTSEADGSQKPRQGEPKRDVDSTTGEARSPGGPAAAGAKGSLAASGAAVSALGGNLRDLDASAETMSQASAALAEKGDGFLSRMSVPVGEAADITRAASDTGAKALGNFVQAQEALTAAEVDLQAARTLAETGILGLEKRLAAYAPDAKVAPAPTGDDKALGAAESRLATFDGRRAVAVDSVQAGELVANPGNQDSKPSLVEVRSAATELAKELAAKGGPKSQSQQTLKDLRVAETKLDALPASTNNAAKALFKTANGLGGAGEKLAGAVQEARTVQGEVDRLDAELETSPDPDAFKAGQETKVADLKARLRRAKTDARTAFPPSK